MESRQEQVARGFFRPDRGGKGGSPARLWGLVFAIRYAHRRGRVEVEDDVSNGGGGSIRESNNGFGWYRFLGRIFFRGVWWFYFFLVVVLVVLGKEFYFFFQIGEWLGVDTRLGMSLMF